MISSQIVKYCAWSVDFVLLILLHLLLTTYQSPVILLGVSFAQFTVLRAQIQLLKSHIRKCNILISRGRIKTNTFRYMAFQSKIFQGYDLSCVKISLQSIQWLLEFKSMCLLFASLHTLRNIEVDWVRACKKQNIKPIRHIIKASKQSLFCCCKTCLKAIFNFTTEI